METTDFIFGLRAVIEAVEAGKEIDKILVKKDLQSELSRELFAVLRGKGIPTQRVPVERINRFTRKNHQGVLAFVSSITYHKLENLVPQLYEEGKQPLLILLDGVTDVRNFGAIARTCECAGIDGIVIPQTGSVSVNGDAIKTSAGALHTLPVCREHDLTQSIKYLRDSGYHIIAATEKGAIAHTHACFTQPTALIMGAEDKGVSPEHLRYCDEKVFIPQYGHIASLNVSVAAGILIYEAIRQRTTE